MDKRFIITDCTGAKAEASYENMLKIVASLSRKGEKFSVEVKED